MYVLRIKKDSREQFTYKKIKLYQIENHDNEKLFFANSNLTWVMKKCNY